MYILRKIFRLTEPLLTDPIDHPDLRRMTSRELMDLPFPRISREGQVATTALKRAPTLQPVRTMAGRDTDEAEAGLRRRQVEGPK